MFCLRLKISVLIPHVLTFLLKLPFHDKTLDDRVKLMQEVVRTLRVMKQDYLPPKARPEGVYQQSNKWVNLPGVRDSTRLAG